jgi:HD-GYP domain-containing protein (c-di-GMP phosphodiesterase class II)
VESKILAIINAYDAMTSGRPYRKAMSYKDASAEIRKCLAELHHN